MKILAIGSDVLEIERSSGATLEMFARECHDVKVVIVKGFFPPTTDNEADMDSASTLNHHHNTSDESHRDIGADGATEYLMMRTIQELSVVSGFVFCPGSGSFVFVPEVR